MRTRSKILAAFIVLGLAIAAAFGVIRWDDQRHWKRLRDEPMPPGRDPGPKDFVEWDIVLAPDGRRLYQTKGYATAYPATTLEECEATRTLKWRQAYIGHTKVSIDERMIPGHRDAATLFVTPVDGLLIANWCAPLGEGRPGWLP